MKKFAGLFVIVIALSGSVISLSYAAGDMTENKGDSKTINGDLLKIDGEFYTVHDMSGHEVRLHVDKTSKLDGTFKTGDKVEVQATDKNHALSMKHVEPKKVGSER
jgi:hypothetical protein